MRLKPFTLSGYSLLCSTVWIKDRPEHFLAAVLSFLPLPASALHYYGRAGHLILDTTDQMLSASVAAAVG